MLFCITNHCTMGCPHCLNNSLPNDNHATKRIVDQFIKFAQKVNTKKIGISGGEPTEHPEFFRYFKKIIKNFSLKAVIVLMSNGQFLNDKAFTKQLITLQKRYPFFIQISAIRGFYTYVDQTIANFNKYMRDFIDITLIESIFTFEYNLGRAKGKDWSKLHVPCKRKAPNCINLFLLSRQVNSFKAMITHLDQKSDYTFCKPMIDYKGDVHAGESIDCFVIGNIIQNRPEQMYQILRTNFPCDNICGVKAPWHLNDILHT